MTKEFCDRCGDEVTGKKSSAVSGISDAAANGTGKVTDSFDIVCRRCYRAWKSFMKPTTTPRIEKRSRRP